MPCVEQTITPDGGGEVGELVGRAFEHVKVVAISTGGLQRLGDVVARVVRERPGGRTAYVIARDLNKDAVPTAQGGCAWSQATVRALLMREGGQCGPQPHAQRLRELAGDGWDDCRPN
jgi:Recombinase